MVHTQVSGEKVIYIYIPLCFATNIDSVSYLMIIPLTVFIILTNFWQKLMNQRILKNKTTWMMMIMIAAAVVVKNHRLSLCYQTVKWKNSQIFHYYH